MKNFQYPQVCESRTIFREMQSHKRPKNIFTRTRKRLYPLFEQTTTSLYNDTTIENIHISKELKNRILHLLLLQALEGANCGNLDEMLRIL